jgi:hypothetical protein
VEPLSRAGSDPSPERPTRAPGLIISGCCGGLQAAALGVGTLLLREHLVTQHGKPLQQTVNQAVLIGASGTLTAAALGTLGPETAVPITAIWAFPTVPAVAAVCVYPRWAVWP